MRVPLPIRIRPEIYAAGHPGLFYLGKIGYDIFVSGFGGAKRIEQKDIHERNLSALRKASRRGFGSAGYFIGAQDFYEIIQRSF